MTTRPFFNPAFNLEAFADPSVDSAPPDVNTLYLRDGKYDSPLSGGSTMMRAGVAASFQEFRRRPDGTRLAMFFHGGLVSKSSGAQGAANQYKVYKDSVFPLFFIWESGIWEVLAHHLPLIFAETLFGKTLHEAVAVIGPKVGAPVATAEQSMALFTEAVPPGARKDWLNEVEPTAVQRGGMTLTSVEIDAFVSAIAHDPDVQREAAAIATNAVPLESLRANMAISGTVAARLSPGSYLSPSVVSAMKGAYVESTLRQSKALLAFDVGAALGAAKAFALAAIPVLTNTVKRYVHRRDHGLTCTTVEEILRAVYGANAGSAIWTEMKNETEDAFRPDSSTYGGTAVIEELCALIKERPGLKTTLVGHSTGAIYIGNFLRHVDSALKAQGDSSYAFDVILMAPANTTSFYAANYGARADAIRLFGMKDSTEKQDLLMSSDTGADPDAPILGRLYPRSLLYLVSGICEAFETGSPVDPPHDLDGDDRPLLGMDRFFAATSTFSDNDYPDVKQARADLSRSPKFARVLSPTDPKAPPGMRSQSLKHGNFPGDEQTIESVSWCFQNGIA
jgi:hypothetical protein